MYQTLLLLHSWLRWLVLISLVISIYCAARGYLANKIFTAKDNAIRHCTATAAHIQLLLGIILYVESPEVKYFRSNFIQALTHLDSAFFGLIHSLAMLTAILLITIGSALAKRQVENLAKFRTRCWCGSLFPCFSFSLPFHGHFHLWSQGLSSDNMYTLFKTNTGRLRILALLEGTSLLILLFIAAPLKHFFGFGKLSMIMGPVHGAFFLLFIFNALSVAIEQKWKFRKTTYKVLLACFIPLGTFYIDRNILRKMENQQASNKK